MEFRKKLVDVFYTMFFPAKKCAKKGLQFVQFVQFVPTA